MITPGQNPRATFGAAGIELTWYRQQGVWLLCRLPTIDEFRVRPDRVRVSKTYTQDELQDLADAGWEFEVLP